MKFVFFLLCLFACSQIFGQLKKIKTVDFSQKQYYTDITFLSEGESHPIKPINTNTAEIAFRVIITTSEIYNSLIIEKVSYGSEGGNKIILSKRKVDLQQIWSNFKCKGEIASIKFYKWLTWDSFELNIQNSIFVVTDISSDSISVSKK